MYRDTNNYNEYKKLRAKRKFNNSKCPLCNIDESEVIEKHKYHLVVTNIAPYQIWDEFITEDHIMLVPISHKRNLLEYTNDEFEEYFKINAEYNNSGYDLFTRCSNSAKKSIPHIHTHLIKNTDEELQSIIYRNSPYHLEYKVEK